MKHLKIGLAVLFILLVSFFVVKSCVHPKRSPYAAEEPSAGVPFFSKLLGPSKQIVMAPPPAPEAPAPKPAASKTGPHMAIILDDWGKNYTVLKYAVQIHRPLTLAIIPYLSHSKQIAEEAHAAGLGVMLHLPMEPFNKGEPMEPHTIMTTMSEKEIASIVDAAVAAIPHVEGANNHMGSAATSDEKTMRVILSKLKAKDLFFLDSHVATTTKGPKVARETGVLFNERDVFIDNENKLDAIKKQLERARRIALSHGEVVVIGHDRKLTLQAIEEMVPEFDKSGVKLVYARDVVRVSK